LQYSGSWNGSLQSFCIYIYIHIMVLNAFLWFLLATPACLCVQYIVPHTTTVILWFPSFGCHLQQQTHSQKRQNRIHLGSAWLIVVVSFIHEIKRLTKKRDVWNASGSASLSPNQRWCLEAGRIPKSPPWNSCLNTNHRNQSEDFGSWYYTSTFLILHD